MTKRPRMQQHASEHGDAGIDGLQDTGSTPVASTIYLSGKCLKNNICRFLYL